MPSEGAALNAGEWAVVAELLHRDKVRVLGLLRELYDGDCCNCNADMGQPHEADCLQERIERELHRDD